MPLRPLLLLLLFLLSLSPAPAEISVQMLEQFEQEAESARIRWQIPAMGVGVVQKGELVWFRGLGKKSDQEPAPPDPDTVFAIGSASKAFGAATLALAVEQGKVRWDDRVVDHLPDFAMADPWVTREFRLFDLFAQHPGVRAYALSLPLSLGFKPEKLMQAWRHVPPHGHFRSTFAYVNIPHLFAGRLVAQLYDQPSWESAVEHLLLQPLQMTRTSGSPEVLQWSNRAPGHVLVQGKVKRGEGGAFPFNAGPAGSLSSTVNDLTRWIDFQCQDGAPLMKPENLLRTRQVQTTLDLETGYGMGWGTAYRSPTPIVWHTGGTLTHSCIVAFEPEQKLGLIILTNLGDQNVAQPLAYRFFDLVHGQERPDPVKLAWEARQAGSDAQAAISAPALPPASADGLQGRYQNEVLGSLRVGPGYRAVLEEVQIQGVLKPIAGDAFWFQATDAHWVNLGLEEMFLLQFERDTTGRVVAVKAYQQGEIGLDTRLTRLP